MDDPTNDRAILGQKYQDMMMEKLTEYFKDSGYKLIKKPADSHGKYH